MKQKLIIKSFLLVSTLLVAAFISSQLTVAILTILLVLSLYSARLALISISIAWLLTSLNPGLFESSEYSTFLKQGIFFSALAGSIFRWMLSKSKRPLKTDILLLFCFSIFVIIVSLYVSFYPQVSVLKTILFTVGLLVLLLCYRELNDEKWLMIENWFAGLFLSIIFLSIPLLFSEFGYIRNLRGFQGIINHPQLFGTVMAMVSVIYTGRLIQAERKNSIYLFLTILGTIFVILSQARTGLLGVIGGFILVLIFLKSFSLGKIFFQKKIIVTLIVLFVVALPFYNVIISEAKEFVTKPAQYGEVEFDEAIQISRGELFLRSYENFIGNPFFGIGFGIASSPISMNVNYDPIFGIPIGAPVEKGVAPMALLEETGIFGTTLFLIFLFYLLRKPVKSNHIYLVWPIFAFLAMNLSEATFASFNGAGALYWLIVIHHVRKAELILKE